MLIQLLTNKLSETWLASLVTKLRDAQLTLSAGTSRFLFSLFKGLYFIAIVLLRTFTGFVV